MNNMPIDDVVESIRGMINFESPLEIDYKEMKDSQPTRGYRYAKLDEIYEAYRILSKEVKTKFHRDLLEFYINIFSYYKQYQQSGELWEISDMMDKDFATHPNDRKLVDIDMDHQVIISLKRYTMSQLRNLEDTTTNHEGREFVEKSIAHLETTSPGSMIVHFRDHPCTQEHSFPFDHSFVEQRPNK